LSSGTASGTTDLLPGGTYSVTAHYPGDATYGPSDSTPISVTVNKENSQPQAFLVTFDSNGNIVSGNTNTAQYGSPYILRVNVDNAAGQLCAPTSSSGATACPTGTVTMTNNGATLDAGSYTLNSYGYFEDLIVQLPGGTDSVKAAYAGDNSFNASSITNAITITPAATTTSQPYVNGGAAVGQSVGISTYVNTTVTTAAPAPSGTVTFYANGTALKGTVSYSPSPGGTDHSAYTFASLTSDTTAFPIAGSYAITATYNGDPNYSTSTSAATDITVLYPTPAVIVTPTSQTVSYGGVATVNGLVDTGNKTAYPTGTVTFVDFNNGATVSGPTQCTNAKDTSGNFACQVVGTFTVTSSDAIALNYSGDANYPSSSGTAFINMPDFTIFPQGQVSMTAGQSQSVTILFQSQAGFSGTVSNFTCSGLPAETTCTFSPSQVTVPNNGSVSTTLTIGTAAQGQLRKGGGFISRRANSGLFSEAMLLLGACVVGIPLMRRPKRIPAAFILTVLFILTSCGGGSSGGGGGGGGTSNPVPAISSLNPARCRIASSESVCQWLEFHKFLDRDVQRKPPQQLVAKQHTDTGCAGTGRCCRDRPVSRRSDKS
jgi:hypothetical protein